jgi:branched-chain amino acid transport system ATP-binding protein
MTPAIERPGPGDAALAGVVLAARGVSKMYGGFRAVDNVDLDVGRNHVHALVGPNGAGKTTLINMLGGQILPTSGEVLFEGQPLGASTPSWRARAGIGRSFQLTSIIPGFTCLQNVVLAVQAKRGMASLLRLRSRPEDVEYAESLLELVGLSHAAAVPAEMLAHGQQKQLEVATALGARPSILLLDEPSSGMSAHERLGLAALLRQVSAAATIVMAEHDVHLVRDVATRVTAFSEGKKVVEGSAGEVFDTPEVRRVFLQGRPDV